VVIFFPSALVRSKDEHLYKFMSQTLEHSGVRVHLVTNCWELQIHTTTKTLLLLDESDYLLFDCVQMLPAAHYVLGFTATKFKPIPSTEAYYLEALGVKTFDSLIPQSYTKNSYDEVQSVPEFFATTNRAKLIFAPDSMVDEIRTLADQRGYNRCIINCEDLAIIGVMQSTDCLVITGSRTLLLRGVDYRCRSGADLLIAKSLNCERSLVQALGRVGRADDDCERYLLKGVKPIDVGLENDMNGALRAKT